MTSNNCSYLNNIFSLNSRVNIREEYDLRLKLKNSICFLLLDKNKPSLSCTQESCLGLKQ
jgi:hypothetical protein